MKTIEVKHGQSITDLALQHYGDVQGVWQICEDNQLNMGDMLTPGQQITIDTTKVINQRLVKQLANKTIATQ